MSYHLLGLFSQGPNNGSPHATWWVRDNEQTLVSQVKRNITDPTHYYLFDGLGSVVGLADETGQVAARYEYEPYGKQSSVEPGVSNPWRYASGYFDSQTKLLKFGTRYYDGAIMRWTQLDPSFGSAGNPSTLNLYAYVGSDPINTVDPLGRHYTDFNITFGNIGGITLGFVFTHGETHFCIGPAITTPGVSVSYTKTPDEFYQGWNTAFSGAIGPALSLGTGAAPDTWFWEEGVGCCGASWSSYYVF
jgi:RHS repeat-associated protein